MKLAEALSSRSALSDKVQQLRNRLKDCLKVQEGDTPAETPDSVIKELDRTLEDLQSLIYRIN
ncbi:MAG: DIP1984 family protein, partial [Muribaculaceae bacterium]|nr:DIP1984 family protein [Muribaculaceae bacterium]